MTQDPDSPVTWTEDGLPRSRLFGDVYFSSDDGLAESRAVFLEGCGLPEAWADRTSFAVGELGFGTGLNIAALLDLWRRTRPADAHLNIFSIEAYPITAAEAARALNRWPELAPVTDLLMRRWPGRAAGRHRVAFPEIAATLDLAILDAAKALAGWSGRADAWFLDGFAPAANPGMWSDDVLALVAARSAPGARAATFTVAGQVRRGLAAGGFTVEKRPGFGRKRERLEARLAGAPITRSRPTVAIVGAGIAGAAAARALRTQGVEPVLIDAEAPGSGGSGNPAALVTPRLDAGLGDAARLYAQAFARATRLYAETPDAVLDRGVLQLAAGPRDEGRFEKIAASDLFEPGALALASAEEVALRLGEPGPCALDQAHALVVDPAAILRAWNGPVVRARVTGLARCDSGWRLRDAAGDIVAQADAVILANAHMARDLAPGMPLSPVRGQASWVDDHPPRPAAAWGGYVLSAGRRLLFGATHDRGDDGVEVRDADHHRNLELLARGLPRLAASLHGVAIEGRASVRAVTTDRLPLAGPAGDDGLFVLSGLGSRGFTFAPLLAEHVAARILGAPSPLDVAGAALVDPGRFIRRSARRS